MTPNPASELLQRLGELSIRVETDGRNLRLSAPTGVLTQELRAQISAHKPELLSLLANRVRVAAAGDDLAPADRSLPLPASFAQKSLWLFHQLQPESPAYNIPATLRLRGPLDPGVLRRSLDEIVRRHEALRTSFEVKDGEPIQVVHAAAPVELPIIDLAQHSESDRTAELRRQLDAEAARPFDLEAGPLLRTTLWRLGAEDHVLQFNVHHVVFDGWSVQLVLAELAKLYGAGGSAEHAGLPPPSLQFADYASWQRRWIEGPVSAEHARFWRELLAGAPELIELPTDRPRPARPSHRGRHLSHVLPATLVEQLNITRRAEGTTLFMLLFAAFNVFLHRYTRQQDIVVGTPVANRTREALEQMVGFFVNVLPIRSRIEGASSFSFREFLRGIRQTTLDAFAHQELPFDRMVEELNPQRSASYSPLFQVLFTHQNVRQSVLDLPGVNTQWIRPENASSKYDITISILEAGESITIGAEFSTDLFDASTIERWLANYEELLRAIANDPAQSMRVLPVMTGQEQRQVLKEWNDTAVEFAREHCVAGIFEDQVGRTPAATALVVGDKLFTFAELNARANQLAHHLHSLGVGPETLAGVCLPRTEELIIALLAVHKAGGAYLPLDPNYPPERLAYILEHARARVLLTHESLLEKLPAMAGRKRDRLDVCLDRELAMLLVQSSENLPPSALPSHLSHVIYTSGSTGRPKGVAIEQRNVVSLLHWARRLYPEVACGGVLASTSICFDLSVFEIFAPLCWGGTVHLAENALALPSLPCRDEIVLVNTVPSAIAELLRVGGIPESVRVVNLAGEPLSCELVDELYALPHVEKVYDLYGPTEDTVYSTFALRQPGAPATIGRPLDNKRVYLLDGNRQPVPIGVPGELYTAGEGVARGYLHAPELTAERFLPDPFAGGSEARMYRTGDLARYRADGYIEFLGRIDNQVKVRGFRIELGEIEAVLREHATVDEAVVMAYADDAGDRRLVAYVTPSSARAVSPGELRAQLSAKLPDYMVPRAIVVVPQFPLTPNGKIDRKALPKPDASEINGERLLVAPRNEAEATVARVWQDVLRASEVGAKDNFFDLGGHSLLAMRVTARLAEAFGRDVPLPWLFAHPTVEALAARIAGNDVTGHSGAIPIVDRSAALPLSSDEQRLWLLHHALADRSTYNVPWAKRLRGPLAVERIRSALAVLSKRHEILRTAYESRDGSLVRVVHETCVLPFECCDIDLHGGETVEAALERCLHEEISRPFELEDAPLLRVQCWRIAADDHALVFVAHHIICDEWSLRVLGNELATLYSLGGDADSASLPVLPIQYADYAAWQQQRLHALEAHRVWWREKLEGAATAVELPFDHARPRMARNGGGWMRRALPTASVQAIEAIGRQRGATGFVTWLAAYVLLLHRLSGQDDIVVGTPLANRSRREVQDLVGFFLNTLPLRFCIEDTWTFSELVEAVRTATVEAFEHGELPLDHIASAGRTTRSAGTAGLFSVMFVHLEEPPEQWRLPGTEASNIPVRISTAKADLTLFLNRTSEGALSAAFEYSSELFTAATLEAVFSRFEVLLHAIAASPNQSVGCLDLLPAAERRQLLDEWNDTAVDVPREAGVHELFEEQAAATPDAIALVCGDCRLSYRALNERADLLAGRLDEAGVRDGTPVALHLERSVAFVVSVLAVLKAGGIYVPLNPDFPVSRSRFMVEDVAAPVLVTQKALPDGLVPAGTLVLRLDEEEGVKPAPCHRKLNTCGGGERVAYVMYTSGSTGQPKGVAIPHRGIVRLVRGQSYVPFGRGQRILMLASTAFDASTFEMWGSLLNGGTCVIFPNHWPEFDALEQVIRRHRVNALFLTSGLFNQIIDQRPALLSTVSDIVTGGESMSASHARRALEALPRVRLSNIYGPTECTTFACVRPLSRDETFSESSIPIGRPIANTRCYILDRHGRPTPVGVPGELCLGGDGLAVGYWKRPEITRERFIVDPTGAERGGRLYRTGDRCRWLANGEIEFVGRFDDQVKIRGFRIEPGEVESALLAMQGIGQAAVMVREDSPGEKRLVAYIVPKPDSPAGAPSIRTELQRQLPHYLVPSSIVMLERLPLNANGKVDRGALPVPAVADGQVSSTGRAPATPLEQELAGIWKRVLGLQTVGAGDDFFELGGHSLLALRLVQEVKERCGRPLSLDVLFHARTIERMAAELERASRSGEAPMLPRLRGHGHDAPLFNIPGIQGVGFLPPSFARAIEGDRPYYDGLRYPGLDGSRPPAERVEDIATELIAQMREVQPTGPYCLFGFCFAGLVAYEIACQLREAGEEVPVLVLWHAFPWYRWQRSPDAPAAPEFAHITPSQRIRSLLQRVAKSFRETAHLSPTRAASIIANRVRRSIPGSNGGSVSIEARLAAAARKANINYRARPYDGRVVVLRANIDLHQRIIPPLGGWGDLVTGGLELHEFDCEHLDLIKEPMISRASALSAERLRAVEAVGELQTPALSIQKSLDSLN